MSDPAISPDDRHRPTPHGADKMKRPLVLAALVELGVAVVNAADWPQWQGPDRTRISKETGLLKEWPVGGPRLVWTANGLGSGYGSMAVAVTAFSSWARVDRTASSSRSIEPMAKRYGPKALGPVESRMRTERGAGPRGTPTAGRATTSLRHPMSTRRRSSRVPQDGPVRWLRIRVGHAVTGCEPAQKAAARQSMCPCA